MDSNFNQELVMELFRYLMMVMAGHKINFSMSNIYLGFIMKET